MAETKDELPVVAWKWEHVQIDGTIENFGVSLNRVQPTNNAFWHAPTDPERIETRVTPLTSHAAAQSRINALLEEVEGLRKDAERYRWIEQFLDIDDVGDGSGAYGLVIDDEAMIEAARRARQWSTLEAVAIDPKPRDAIDAAIRSDKGGAPA